jgi:drug/metabolite transporter (DMT)-like permease
VNVSKIIDLRKIARASASRVGAMPTEQTPPADARIGATLGIAVVFAGAAYPVTAAALRFTSASVITTSRALVGGLLMLPVLRLVGSSLPRDLRGWGWAAVISVGNVALTLAGIAEGTRLAGAAIASVLLNSAPFFAALFARLLLGEALTRRHIGGLVIGFAGILLIVGSPSGSGTDVTLGIVICLVGAIGWAAAGLAMRYLSTRDTEFDVYGATTAQFLTGGILLLPYLLTTRPTPTDWSSGELWASLVFLVVGAQVITYVGFYAALRWWSSARVFSWTFLAPAVAVAIEAAQGNLPSTAATIGLLVVITGVALVTRAG